MMDLNSWGHAGLGVGSPASEIGRGSPPRMDLEDPPLSPGPSTDSSQQLLPEGSVQTLRGVAQSAAPVTPGLGAGGMSSGTPF